MDERERRARIERTAELLDTAAILSEHARQLLERSRAERERLRALLAHSWVGAIRERRRSPDPEIGVSMVMDASLRGVRVLIVDDDADSRELLGFALGRRGAEVRLAESAEHAREVLTTWTPGVVMSDLTLREEDGHAFVRSLRRDPALQEIPAIALTGAVGEQARGASLEAGFQKQIAKPVDIHELVRTIGTLVGSSPR